MAIASTTVWEVRTTGDAGNGGGFNPARGGTDYSQQDSAQLSLTDLACASNTTLTSATGGFTAAMVGNVIYIASGTNAVAGYYEITAYTDTNTVTIDRTCATGGNMADGVGKVGGASNHPQTITAALIAGNTIYVKAGTYQKVGANAFVLNYTVAGTSANPIKWLAYDTDRTVRPIGDNRTTLDGGTDTTNVVLVGQSWNIFDSFIIKRASNVGVNFSSNYNFVGINLRITANGGGGITRNNSTGAHVFLSLSELDNNGSQGIYSSASSMHLLHCYVHDNSSIGAYNRYGSSSVDIQNVILNSIFESNSNNGIRLGDDGSASFNYIISGNIIYNNTGTNIDGVRLYSTNSGANNSPFAWVFNNVSVYNTRHGFSGLSSSFNKVVLFDFNATYGNGGNGIDSIKSNYGINTNGVTADPKLNNPGAGDFTLQSGSPLIGAGLDVSTFTSLTTDFNVNIGVDQTNPDGGGGGTTVSNWFAGE